MKEVQLTTINCTQSIEMPPLSPNKEPLRKFWLPELKSSIYWLPMLEEEKSVFLEEPVSEKPYLFKN